MRKWTLTVLCGLGTLSAPVVAQPMHSGLRGFRIEANAGSDRYDSANSYRSKFGYGASVGVDAQFSQVVLGVEGSYWRDSDKPINCVTGGAGTFCNSVDREWSAAARAGYAFTPQWMIFAKGGFVRTRQRDVFTSSGGTFYVNGQFVPGPPSSYASYTEGGYQLGGGLEYTLNGHVYADAQYVYSHYRNDNTRNRLMLGLGYRF